MTDAELQYKQALEIDLMRYMLTIMMGFFLKQFNNPHFEVENLLDTWSVRVKEKRKELLEQVSETPDVTEILCDIVTMTEGFNRDQAVEEVKANFKEKLTYIIDHL